jgi:hypothetical protein
VELALSVKANPEIPLSTNEMRIAQAGIIAFLISSRGVEPARHALEQFIKRRSRHGGTHYPPHREMCFLAALEMLAMNWVRSELVQPGRRHQRIVAADL